ncbi:response regulator [Crocosphaera watsonii]|uniref:histidine kinase n=1 Tax=Crocosphaera watsonii WH 0401 TaxID=555881 RepID=T2J508_CROWT|nr:response regulator [Crocosphaera watsonii]CCQ60285.1 Sensory box/GGDEF family protein [Crocosphaera watsonii WH 0401]
MNNRNEKKGDILIVDDIPENLQLLFTMLTKQGYEVRRVLSGKQALNVVKVEPPDLILLDIRMPELDGYEVCQRLKADETTQNIPVIFLSALNETFDKVTAFQVGGVDYISKPFQLQEVIIRVENQLNLLEMQRKLEEKNKELELVNKELEAFGYRVSHDLRNHLNVINSIIYLLSKKHGQKLDNVGLKNLKILEDESELMAEIIEDLWRLSESKSNYLDISLESFDLSGVVRKIVDRLKIKMKEKEKIVIIESDVYATGDEGLIKIAVENLLDNANKFTNKTEQPRIEFGQLQQQDQTVYFVKDNGVGFDTKKGNNLFTPFQRLHQEQEFPGTGIGLATVTSALLNFMGGKFGTMQKLIKEQLFTLLSGNNQLLIINC